MKLISYQYHFPIEKLGKKLKVELDVVTFFTIDTEKLCTMCAKYNFSNFEGICSYCLQFRKTSIILY